MYEVGKLVGFGVVHFLMESKIIKSSAATEIIIINNLVTQRNKNENRHILLFMSYDDVNVP